MLNLVLINCQNGSIYLGFTKSEDSKAVKMHCMYSDEKFRSLVEVQEAMRMFHLFTAGAEDYFIYTRDAVNWTEVHDLVVGK